MNSRKLAIIGYGFVGKATDYGFSKNIEKLLIDPILNTKIDEVSAFNPDLIFLCLPTPMLDDGNQDSSLITESLNKLSEFQINVPVVIKSTVLPNVLEKSASLYKRLVYNPEFLREKNAQEDFINSPMIILGGNREDIDIVKDFYKYNSICKTKNFIEMDVMTASLIKYTINSFLATKVTFFNELKDIFDSVKGDISWEKFIQILSIDARMGDSHMMVPGHDGRYGFGGACFTKDTAALINFSRSIKKDFKLLESAVKINNQIRSLYKDLDEREKDQNVNYNFED